MMYSTFIPIIRTLLVGGTSEKNQSFKTERNNGKYTTKHTSLLPMIKVKGNDKGRSLGVILNIQNRG